MTFFVSSISYRPTDLLLQKQFSKNVSFSNIYNFIFECALLSTLKKSMAKVLIQTRPWLVVENTSLHFANPISLNALC